MILCGTGLMAMILPPLLSRLIGAYGWQAGFIALGAMPLLFTLPLALMWLRMPVDVAAADPLSAQPQPSLSGMSFRQALRSGKYWGSISR